MSFQFNNWRSDPSESHGPLMSITCWSLGGVSLLFLVVRCGIRQSQKKFWYDDGLLVISWVSDSETQAETWPLMQRSYYSSFNSF